MSEEFDIKKEYEKEQRQAQKMYGDNFSANRAPAPQPQVNGYVAEPSLRASSVFKLLGGIFLAIGLVISVVCLLVVHFTNENRKLCTETTMAVVTENREHGEGYAAVFRYTASNGNVYEKISDVSSDPPMHNVGDEVELHYQPDDPNNFYADDMMWLVRTILYSISGIFFSIGTIFVVVGFKIREEV
ncbi:MAG: DUF3592 domain-containing protein [Ruminococcus sp.]|nr:DUF3592 domain-containing protein [Ruminococcus sp.]